MVHTSQVGVNSVVLEKGPALREEGAAIGLWSNAWKALDALDVADALRPHYLPLSRSAAAHPGSTSCRHHHARWNITPYHQYSYIRPMT